MKVEKTRYLIPPTKQDWGELSPKSKPQVPPSPFSSGIHNHQLNKDIIERPLISNSQNLSFKGLPCPNLGDGGYNFHGRYEYVSISQMRKMVKLIIELLKA